MPESQLSIELVSQKLIVSELPGQIRLNVPKDTAISVTFGTDMNASTIISNTFKDLASQTGLQSGTYSYNVGSRIAAFNIDSDFAPGEILTVILTTGIENSDGDTLTFLFERSFTIEAVSGSGTFIPLQEFHRVNSWSSSAYSIELDGDGDMDLTVSNINSLDISVFMNNSDGSFQPKTKILTNSLNQS